MTSGNGKFKVITILIGVIQALLILMIAYWTGRIEKNTDKAVANAAAIVRIETQLDAMARQIDRIEIKLDAHVDQMEGKAPKR